MSSGNAEFSYYLRTSVTRYGRASAASSIGIRCPAVIRKSKRCPLCLLPIRGRDKNLLRRKNLCRPIAHLELQALDLGLVPQTGMKAQPILVLESPRDLVKAWADGNRLSVALTTITSAGCRTRRFSAASANSRAAPYWVAPYRS
jgi:hypothetical protein